MDPTLAQLIQLLAVYGPWLLFAMAILETSFVTGLVVPSGVATSAATVLALEGQVALAPFVVAALAGGAVGDSVGFAIGRAGGGRILAGTGFWARLARRHHEAMALLGRHPIYSVTLARLVSFVRTLMPMAAGMSGMTYRRYLPFELVGLLGWGALYVALGLVARQSWALATRLVGWGGAAIFLVAGLVFFHMLRRRSSPGAGPAVKAPRGSESEPSVRAAEPPAPTPEPPAAAPEPRAPAPSPTPEG